MSESGKKEELMEGAVESARWRVERLERVVGTPQQQQQQGSEAAESLGATAKECAELQKRLVKTLPNLEEFWRLHADVEAALRARDDASSARDAIEHAADVLESQEEEARDPEMSMTEDTESLRKELERSEFGAPERSSAVYNTPEYRERLARVATRSTEQAKQAAELRERILALVKANVLFTQEASAQLLALDALVARQDA